MKDEFTRLAKRPVSDEDYRTIDFVYTYHPGICELDGKEQIATIFNLPGGMRIIQDMVYTAEVVARLEKDKSELQTQIQKMQERVEEINRQMNDLKS